LFVDQHKCRSLRTSGVLLKNSAALCSHSRRTRTPFLLTLGANVLTFEANCLRTSAICSHYKRTAVRKNDPLVELQAFWLWACESPAIAVRKTGSNNQSSICLSAMRWLNC
jgi:hypothetical protein